MSSRLPAGLPSEGIDAASLRATRPAAVAPRGDVVRELERSRILALLQRDMPLLWQLHAPDYQLITPTGRSFTRERYLRDIESGNLRYLRWDAGDMNVRTSEQMAIVRYQATLELDAGNGHGTPIACWHTDSYELSDGVWLATWSQATAIR